MTATHPGASPLHAEVPARLPGLAQVRLQAPVFISDLHLTAQRPRSLAGFHAFLASLGPPVAELLILGDLFEFWAGDDALDGAEADDTVGAAVADALARLADRGIATYLMHGNRDVLLARAFLARSGAQLLADPAVAILENAAVEPAAVEQGAVEHGALDQAAGGPLSLLLSHGDAYCTLDLAYQAFRRQARDAGFQAAFLHQPLAQRRALIGQARARSEAGKAQTAAEIMDVTPDAIAGALRAAGLRHLLHGHTHRPAHHAFSLDGAAAHRWVLPDWELEANPPRGGGLQWLPGSAEPSPIAAVPGSA